MRTLLSLTAVAACTLLVVGCSKGKTSPRDYRGKFAIDAPTGWEAKEDLAGTLWAALSPEEKPGDTFRENVNVVMEPVGSMTSEQYHAAFAAVGAKALTDYKELKSGEETVGGVKAMRVEFTHRMGELKLHVAAYQFTKDGLGYVITCTATPETFQTYEPQFRKTVETFRFR